MSKNSNKRFYRSNKTIKISLKKVKDLVKIKEYLLYLIKFINT